jgi:phosphoribosyl 1,2-cyclic phosphodiesterase
MVEYCALASGSNGNCYYVGNETQAVLIDAGISRRQLMKRMKQVGLDLRKVVAVFITHEHSDHNRGIRVISDLQNIPVYMTAGTLQKTKMDNRPCDIHTITAGDTIEIGDFRVHSFSKKHDAVDPCSFRIELNNLNVGVFTDLGAVCSKVAAQFAQCDVAFLESNYDQYLLEEGPYPVYLKKRVASDRGHLSNDQAVALASAHIGGRLKTLLLSHISADNNRVDIAMNAFRALEGHFKIIPTSRYEPTAVYRMESPQQAKQLTLDCFSFNNRTESR